MISLKEALSLQKRMEEANAHLLKCKADLAALEKQLDADYHLKIEELDAFIAKEEKELKSGEESLQKTFSKLQGLFHDA